MSRLLLPWWRSLKNGLKANTRTPAWNHDGKGRSGRLDHPEAEPDRDRRQRHLQARTSTSPPSPAEGHERRERDRHDGGVGEVPRIVDIDPLPELDDLGSPADERAALVGGLARMDDRGGQRDQGGAGPDGPPEVAIEIERPSLGPRLPRVSPSVGIGPWGARAGQGRRRGTARRRDFPRSSRTDRRHAVVAAGLRGRGAVSCITKNRNFRQGRLKKNGGHRARHGTSTPSPLPSGRG